MEISVAHGPDGAANLAVTGEMDLATAARFTAAAKSELTGGVTAVTIDLAGVSFMDSTGLGCLVEIKNDADARGIALTLHAPSERVVEVLRLTGMIDAFAID